MRGPGKAAPPPPAKARGGVSARKENDIVALFQKTMKSRMKKVQRAGVGVGVGVGGRGVPGAPRASNPSDVKGELESRSKHMAQIKEDVNVHGQAIQEMAAAIRKFRGGQNALVGFMEDCERRLTVLSDEVQVLKHFTWPEAKVEAMREVLAVLGELEAIGSRFASWDTSTTKNQKDNDNDNDNPKHTHNHARFDRMDKFKAMDAIRDGCLEMDRIQPRVERILCNAAALQAKATKYGIDVALEESIAGAKRKASTLALTVMRLALEHLSENDGQMMKTFKLAFRIHQFAGGFDGEETAQCYREIHQLLSA